MLSSESSGPLLLSTHLLLLLLSQCSCHHYSTSTMIHVSSNWHCTRKEDVWTTFSLFIEVLLIFSIYKPSSLWCIMIWNSSHSDWQPIRPSSSLSLRGPLMMNGSWQAGQARTWKTYTTTQTEAHHVGHSGSWCLWFPLKHSLLPSPVTQKVTELWNLKADIDLIHNHKSHSA